ncbi:ATP-dependent sacrificial sulfur transferase LarE [Mobilitalea sibirica]|uniref:ATP-dependent sacrificial sulfur transferase LarE n=1 Tax=Mobilitalea sibirica TaxID=1462919 RepID=A0A8J7H0Z4_9FIRM|nr:ATP-dependent sacrificial sulfur transferase LarE [Mobilitalea sibirica]MBH1939913.1 ATP-dependent sacrificial sulfur transferase LarE [Mobilitalea sibirica]
MTLEEKYQQLKSYIKNLESLAIAYSGGVDSTFLLKVAYDVLGEKVIAVTATSSTYPKREFEEAKRWIEDIGAKHIIIESEELDIDGFSENPTNRCYYCKKELFEKVKEVAENNGIVFVADGSNYDDLGDFRPGMQAAAELKVVSPLKEVKMTKEDIRIISKDLQLPTWSKPAFACLSSRFPYGHKITKEKLSMVEQAEDYLYQLGFRQLRVRHHEDTARIELGNDEFDRFINKNLMRQVGSELKRLGFTYVTLDLNGYRTGSMNEVLKNGDL